MYKMDQEQYLHEVGQNLADLFYNQKNINMKEETLEEAAEKYNDDFQIKGGSKAPHIKNVHIMNHFIEGAKWMEEQMEKLKDFDTWKEWVNEKS